MPRDIEYPGPADNWGDVINQNFENIVSDINTIENALIDISGGEDYDDLKGTYASLAERLASVIENSTMLQDWVLSRASNLETTNTINARVQKVEQDLMVQKNNESILSGAPDAVQHAWDQRSVGGMDDQFFSGGDIGRWGPNGLSAIKDASAGSTGRNVYCHADPIYAALGSRWYQNVDGEYKVDIPAGTWTAFYQTFEETTTASLICEDTQLALDSSSPEVNSATTSVTINGLSFDENAFVGPTGYQRPRAGDIVTLGVGGNYKVASSTLVGSTWTLAFYGKVDPAYHGSGASVSWRVHRPWQIPYCSFHKSLSDADIVEKLAEGGRTLCGQVVVVGTGTPAVTTQAVEYNTFSRYKFVEMSTAGWGASAGSISATFNAMKGFFKNAIPVVVTSCEVIYAMDLGVGWKSNTLYLYKPYASNQVTTSPATGSAVNIVDIDTVGVLVEI
jgi:hypothetical protein